MAKKDADKFKFRRHGTIGAAAAEEDERFLTACFINTGDLDTLLDCENPENRTNRGPDPSLRFGKLILG